MEYENYKTGFPVEVLKEGKIAFLAPKLDAFIKSPSEYAPSKAPVFYNPVMELNRDLAVLALETFQKNINRKINICEPLAGCGVRGIRFAAEVSNVKKVIINDINKEAFKLANHNVKMNSLQELVLVKNEDANLLLATYNAPYKRFDVIDIDPFGPPVPYIDSTIRALRNGGLIALTATDMAPLCGVHPKACIRKYGGKPLRTEYCHELAVRLLIGCLAITAAKFGIGINVMFSHSTDHYIRTYATISHSAKKANENIKNMGYIFHCFKCYHREAQKQFFSIYNGKCKECASKIDFAGPLWLGKLFDNGFCRLMEKEALQRKFRLKGYILKILDTIRKEIDAPITYYVTDKLSGHLTVPVPPIKTLYKLLMNNGYKTSLTHFSSKGLRTEAPAKEVKKIIKLITKLKKNQSTIKKQLI
jgi:tRNA (guanine26-N2/guanine27-N2)-dimethyltransferase